MSDLHDEENDETRKNEDLGAEHVVFVRCGKLEIKSTLTFVLMTQRKNENTKIQ